MRIAIGSDHGGWNLKEHLKALLKDLGHEPVDFGCNEPVACDYPDIARNVGHAVGAGEYDRGILVCGSGIGMSMAANKVRGVRAAACQETYTARYSRLHNDANVLCLGERVVGLGVAGDILTTWLTTEFEGGRHERRVQKIMELEKG